MAEKIIPPTFEEYKDAVKKCFKEAYPTNYEMTIGKYIETAAGLQGIKIEYDNACKKLEDGMDPKFFLTSCVYITVYNLFLLCQHD